MGVAGKESGMRGVLWRKRAGGSNLFLNGCLCDYNPGMETKWRSVIKALSWRFVATLITSAIVFFLTGKAEFAAKVGLLDTTIKLFVYFMHERLWLRVPFGRIKPTEYQI